MVYSCIFVFATLAQCSVFFCNRCKQNSIRQLHDICNIFTQCRSSYSQHFTVCFIIRSFPPLGGSMIVYCVCLLVGWLVGWSFVTLLVVSQKAQIWFSWNFAQMFSICAKCHYKFWEIELNVQGHLFHVWPARHTAMTRRKHWPVIIWTLARSRLSTYLKPNTHRRRDSTGHRRCALGVSCVMIRY